MKTILMLTALSAFTAPTAVAQDYTHPRRMNLAAPGFRVPDPRALQQRLPNGIVAYIAEDHTVPLVTLIALVRAGTVDDAKPGTAEALEQALRAGPESMALAEMTAEYQVSMGRELTQITLNVPAEDAWRALDLLAATLRRPRITAPGLSARPVSFEGSLPVAVSLFEDLLYGVADVAELTQADVAEFHSRFFVPSNIVLGVAGDFDPAEARRRLQQAFGDWRGSAPPRRPALPPVALSGPRAVHTFNVEKLQGWVVVGHELPLVPLEEEPALHVMNYILAGDHLAGRMFLEARDRRGLTNDAVGFPEPRLRGAGSYTFRSYGRPEAVTPLIDIWFREVARIQAAPVTEEELFVAKGALADGVFVYQFRNGHTTAETFAREWASYGDHRRSATYAQRVRAVTADQVQAAARKYLHPDRMHIVVVGPIAAIRDAAQKGGSPALEIFGRSAKPQ